MRSDQIVADEAGQSRATVQRYIRLTELIPELLDMVDNGQLKFNPAVELSYLAKQEQQDFLSAMDYAQTTPSLSQAQRIKKLAQEGECTLGAMCDIMNEIKKEEQGNGVLTNTTNLAEISFGGKTNIGSNIFSYSESSPNTALKKLSFPEGSTFGSGIFGYCVALEKLVFNGDADLTAGDCFDNLPALKTIDFKGKSDLSSSAFSNTTNLAEINFGGKTSIGGGMFYYTESNPNNALKELSFPVGSTFNSGVFGYCVALEKLVFNGDADLTAGGCFYNVPALETVEFKGESKLSSGAIGGAVSLKTLKFGGKTDIGDGVLGGAGTLQASGMDDIVIPAGSTVGISAFEGANITSIEFKDTTPPTFGANAFADCPQDGIIYVPGEAYDAYVAALNEAAEGAFAANPVPLQIKKAEEKPNEPVCDHANKEWNKDAEGHWYVCPNCEELEKEVDEHEYDGDADADCNVCGYEREITVPEPDEEAPAVELNKETLALVVPNGEKLIATVTPEGLEGYTLVWSSSDASVATVDENGKVTAVAAGTANITVTLDAGATRTTISDTCVVTVTEATPEITKYNATVNNGTGAGEYAAGEIVTIIADVPAEGNAFDKWVVVDGTVTFTDATKAETTFTMPEGDVVVEAIYKNDGSSSGVIRAYDIEVVNGKSYDAAGAETTMEGEGTKITLKADAAAEGKEFDKWVVNKGNVTLANAEATETTFTMPAEDVEVTATYKNKAITPTPDYEDEDEESVIVKVKFDGVDEDEIEKVNAILVRNGKVYKDKDITEKKDWKHEWTGLDEDYKWTVDAEEIEGYEMDIENLRGNYWVITLSAKSTAEKTNPDTGASDFVGAAVALAVCSAVSGAALMLRRK